MTISFHCLDLATIFLFSIIKSMILQINEVRLCYIYLSKKAHILKTKSVED